MKTLLKILFVYIPAFIAYILIGMAVLMHKGYLDYPDYFNENDYQEIYSETIDNAQITYHTLK